MADKDASRLLPTPSSEDLRIANGHFEYANRAVAGGNFDIAIGLLRTCCRLVPGHLPYRQALRKAEKNKFKNNHKGSALAPLTTSLSRLKLWRARQGKNYGKVLEHGEAILARNPWDKAAHLHMAEAAMALQLPVVAIWILQEVREKNANDVDINRALARLLEREGHYNQAIHLWELVRKVLPTDAEAQEKTRQLAVSETLVRGGFEAPGDPATPSTSKLNTTPIPQTRKFNPQEQRKQQELQTLRARLESDPARVESYLQLATYLRRQGQIDEARAALQQGLEATNQAVELTLALADLEIDPYRRAVAKIDEELRAQPDNTDLVSKRKKIEKKLNSLEIDFYRQKAEHDSADKSHHFELGVRLWRAGQIDEAIRELQVARADARLHWQALMYLGHCFQGRDNWQLARRNFEEALKNMPDGEQALRKEVLFQLAQGHANAGELERAIELALDLADLDYSYRDIGLRLDEWQRRLGQNGSPTKPR
jgi:tetratricopeptide (TPR) repeat protein